MQVRIRLATPSGKGRRANKYNLQTDIDFVRYMAENLSALDYKTQEEVLTVIRHLTLVLSTAGMQVYAVWAPQVQPEAQNVRPING